VEQKKKLEKEASDKRETDGDDRASTLTAILFVKHEIMISLALCDEFEIVHGQVENDNFRR